MHASPILTLAALLVSGLAAGAAAKACRLPSVTGQIVVGVLLGPSVLGWVTPVEAHGLRPVLEFALGLMAVAVGSHLGWRRLANAGARLRWLLLAEVVVTPVLVIGLTLATGAAPWSAAVILGAIAVSTAPATTLALVADARARGVFVKTLLAGVALNNLACIALFETARTVAHAAMDPARAADLAGLLLRPARQLGLGALLGVAVGGALVLATRRATRPERTTSLSLVAILLVVGLAGPLDVSAPLAGLALGVTLANLTPSREEIGHAVFADFEYAIFAVFFTVAGTELSFERAAVGGALALGVFAARAAGKVVAANLAMRIAGAPLALRRHLGAALIPQAGLAVGLVFLVVDDPVLAPIQATILPVVLSMVLLNELVGPVFARRAIVRSGEAGLDRPRVLDFLHEEHIVTGLRGTTMDEVIGRLADHLVRTTDVVAGRDVIVAAAVTREREQSTCLGEGLAVPHARVPVGTSVAGVVGLSAEGLDVPTPDGRRLHCVVLLATPPGAADRHLLVLAALARVVGGNADVREALYASSSPAHAHVLLHGDATAIDFNHFLDDDASAVPAPVRAH